MKVLLHQGSSENVFLRRDFPTFESKIQMRQRYHTPLISQPLNIGDILALNTARNIDMLCSQDPYHSASNVWSPVVASLYPEILKRPRSVLENSGP